jgi:hypothetical protein
MLRFFLEHRIHRKMEADRKTNAAEAAARRAADA